MSGDRRGVSASAMRLGLRVASGLYGIGVAWRNRRFDSGRDVHRCEVPVVSVGNLTAGGTGKTPVVSFLAKHLRSQGKRVAIVSRGYGRGEAGFNDEALELYERLPDVPHVQDPDRVEAARIAVDELEAEVILMDDGFQHRRLHRDLDLVLIDASCPFGFGFLLPRGLLREPVENLKRADAVILTRCDLVEDTGLGRIESKIRSHLGDRPIFRSVHRPSELLRADGSRRPVEELRDKDVLLFSGIGNPDAFRRTVESVGGRVIATQTLPDHAEFDRQAMETLAEMAGRYPQADRWVCTHKDLVKVRSDRVGGKPVDALMIDLALEDDGKLFGLLGALTFESGR